MSKKAEKISKAVEEKKITEYLKVEFTAKERADMSLELARFINELGQKELQKKKVVKSIDAEIAQHESSISMFATKVHDGHEYKNVDCVMTLNYEVGHVVVTRTDTGAIINERAMTEEERQRSLAFQE